MDWLILLLLVSPVFYASYRSYCTAGATQVSLRVFVTAMCFALALAAVVVLLASRSNDIEGGVDDIGNFFF